MKTLWIVAGAMIVVAGVGGVAARSVAVAARGPQGLEACRSAETRAGLRDAILTRIVARGGEADAGYAFSLDTPRLESVDYTADRTICGGVARLSVPEYRRAGLDGVSELSDSVRFMIEPSRTGSGRVVALVGGGDVMANWLGAPPAPPSPPSPDLLRVGYDAEASEPTPSSDATEISAAATGDGPGAPRPSARVSTASARPTRPEPRTPDVAPAPRRTAPPTPPTRRAETPPPPAPVARPSFDCRRARNSAERTICSDPGLADLDVQMARRYARMQNNVDGKAAQILRDEQREWLRRRDACETRPCLALMYRTRAARMDRMG